MSPNRLLCFCAAARYELVHHIDDCFIAYRCLLIKNDIVVNATTALGDTSTTAPNHISLWLRANTTFSILYLLTDHQAFKTHYTFIPTYAKLIPLTHHALLLVVSYLLVLGTERVSAGGGQSLSFPLSESTASTRTLCFMQVPSLAAPQRFYSEVCDVCEHTARTILHFFMWKRSFCSSTYVALKLMHGAGWGPYAEQGERPPRDHDGRPCVQPGWWKSRTTGV